MNRSLSDRKGPGGRAKRAEGTGAFGIMIISVIIGIILIAQSSLITAANAPAKPEEKKAASEKSDSKKEKPETRPEGRPEEKKAAELTAREEAVRKEEERIKILRKELDDKIDRYTKLLEKMEETLKSVDASKNEKMAHIIKAYETMPNEEAAARLSALDEQTAVRILVSMKSKKAGTVMAAMEPKKAAALTEGMLSIAKKFPVK